MLERKKMDCVIIRLSKTLSDLKLHPKEDLAVTKLYCYLCYCLTLPKIVECLKRIWLFPLGPYAIIMPSCGRTHHLFRASAKFISKRERVDRRSCGATGDVPDNQDEVK
jgi:hypothetical protein